MLNYNVDKPTNLIEYKICRQSNLILLLDKRTSHNIITHSSCFLCRPYLSERTILNGVKDRTIFGIIECDVRVPEHLKDRFKDFQPILKSCLVSKEDIGAHMKAFCEANDIFKTPRRTLLGSYHATKHLMATDLLKWYLEEGIVVDKVHWIVQYHRSRSFAKFGQGVMTARRRADLDPTTKIQADMFKLIGNSAYGKTIIDKQKFTDYSYMNSKDVIKVSSFINNKRFRDLAYIGEKMVEVESFKPSVRIDSNVVIGFTVLERSKLILLRFVHNFLHKYFPRHSYCLFECDTDSMYLSLSGKELFGLVKPDLQDEFKAEYTKWFASIHCQNHNEEFFTTVFSGASWITANCEDCVKTELHWRREVGLFHIEFEGSAFAGLSPKCYYCVGEKDKYSAKGVSKKLNKIKFEDFKSVIQSSKPVSITNRGFRMRDNSMHTYIQKKVGLAYLYIKRIVADNGIDTYPTNV